MPPAAPVMSAVAAGVWESGLNTVGLIISANRNPFRRRAEVPGPRQNRHYWRTATLSVHACSRASSIRCGA